MENPPKEISIPIDGSKNSLKSLDYISLVYGPNQNISIDLVYVVPALPDLLSEDQTIEKDTHGALMRAEKRLLNRADRILKEAKRELLNRGFDEKRISTTYKRRQTGIAQDVCHWARSKKTDALLLTRRGQTDLETFFMGRVSNSILEYCKDTPVWIAGERIHSKKILLCTDGSENALRAVDHAGFMLSGTDCQVTIFHTLRHLKRFVPSEVLEDTPELEKSWTQIAGKTIAPYIDEAKKMLLGAGLKENQVFTKVVDGSRSPANDVLNEARNNGHGTIVLGKRGMSKVKEFLFGSVTRKILYQSAGLCVWVVQ